MLQSKNKNIERLYATYVYETCLRQTLDICNADGSDGDTGDMALASGIALSQTLITMSTDQRHPGTGAREGAVCFGTTFIDH